MKNERVNLAVLPRNSSGKNSKKIIPSNYYFTRSPSYIPEPSQESSDRSLVRNGSPVSFRRLSKTRTGSSVSTLLKSFLSIITFPNFRWLNFTTTLSITTPSLGRKVTGTLFGNRRGHVSFAVQDDPRSVPVLIIELAVSTSALVKEMSSGLVRIALECEKTSPSSRGGGQRQAKLFCEPTWTMYCNGKKCGYALSRAYTDSDWHLLSTIERVSIGAGVIPVVEDGRKVGASEGELLYMRARFERVVGSRDSEAFYMMNPDGTGGPELSIFLLRI